MNKDPKDILRSLRDANPNASEAELKELMFKEMLGSPQLAKSIFDEVFDSFSKETGFRINTESGATEFVNWLKRPHK
ncbi:hypothetical protein [Bradyrhizobium elkanii]|uniref:hypothetical protein n=1 Tax=Bradyrhizobium elkanii TaxID=29448 RepID=UPI0004B34C1E|nr:hypothetical protein [Bradyrhizobium elkanii]